MGKTKQGKNRLDKFYKLAKEQGFRSRAAYKLIQLNRKYSFLDQARGVIDLCAAPGGWMQVAGRAVPSGSIVVGVDLVPIKPIPRCVSLVQDIRTSECKSELKQELKNTKVDVVLHDGSPNVGQDWRQDAFAQSELVLASLKLATSFLEKKGWFITKLFRSKDYNPLMYIFNQLFEHVEATKPISSRSVSAEIYIICKDYRAPIKIDPKLLDPKHVFMEIEQKAASTINSVFHPTKDKRKREGYDEDLYSCCTVDEFLMSDNPIQVLVQHNELKFKDKNYLENASLEIKECCKDLKVLNKKDYKLLLKWRKKTRKQFCMDKEEEKKEEKEEEEEEDLLEKAIKDRDARIKADKRKRRLNEAKHRLRLEQLKDQEEKKDDTRGKLDLEINPNLFFANPIFDLEEKVEKKEKKILIDSDVEDDGLGLELAMKNGINDAKKLCLAQKLLKDKQGLVDDSFNRYSFEESERLPLWFQEEEKQYNRMQVMETKEQNEIMKQKQRALNARPIKKVLEAKARKRKRAQNQLLKSLKKAATVAEADLSEQSKAKSIQSLLSKNIKRQHKKPSLIISRGPNKAIKGRPKGVKGRYKMVDKRQKKDVRKKKSK